MGDESKIPGATFWLEATACTGLVNGKMHVKLTLVGTVENEEAFKKIHKRFDGGFRVSYGSDFRGQMLRVLQADNVGYEQRIRDLEAQLLNAKREAASREGELANYRQSFRFLQGRGKTHGDGG